MTRLESKSGNDTRRYHVPNLVRALDILEHLARQPAGQTMAEIADALKLPRNSVFRITATLADCGYLQRDEETRRFALGRKLLTLGYASVSEANLVERCLDAMRDLRDATRETTLLGTLVDTEGVVLEQVPGLHPVKFMVDVGTRFPLHTGAPGKALLAALPPEERGKLMAQLALTRFNKRTLTTRKALAAELAQAARHGYAVDRGEQIDGIRCVSAAILDHRGHPLAALWVTGPAERLREEDFPAVAQTVMAQARRISRRFGWEPETG